MSRLDYSKWDHIEISDDEDDTHPNVDTASLFRWRHDARLERMKEQEKERNEFESGYKSHNEKLSDTKQKLKEAEENATADMQKLKLEVKDMEQQEKDWRKKEEELAKKEKQTPLNVDTICHDGKSRTIINSSKHTVEELTEEEKGERYRDFIGKHRDKVRKFGMMRRYEDSQQYLVDHRFLVCEEAANYLVVWCIDLEVEQKHDLMDHVSHQTIVMQFILELAKQLNRDPRECVGPFFSRIKITEKQYMESFNDELDAFKDRVKARAKVRIDEAMKEYEEEEKQKRIGPGGLDPVEVFESLPKELQQCFEKKEIGMLQSAIAEMPKEEAEYHMKRCVASGLWVPNAADAAMAGTSTDDGGADMAVSSNTEDGDEETYETIEK